MSNTQEAGDATTSKQTSEVDLAAMILQLQQSIQNNNQTLTQSNQTLHHEIQTLAQNNETLQQTINVNNTQTNENLEKINEKMESQERRMQEMFEQFRSETIEDLETLNNKIEKTKEEAIILETRLETIIKIQEKKTTKELQEAIVPINNQLQKLEEERRTPYLGNRDNVQVVIHPEMFRTEAEQKFYGDGRTNPKIFLKHLKNAMERTGGNVDLKKYLRTKFVNDAEMWYDIVEENFQTFEEFEEIFLRHYWGHQTQAKIRENLYNGHFNAEFGTSRERYAMKKFAIARQLEPPMPERDIILYIARHFEEEIGNVVTIQEICGIERFLMYLRRIDDARSVRRNRPQYTNRWEGGSTSYNKNKYEMRNQASYNNNNYESRNNNRRDGRRVSFDDHEKRDNYNKNNNEKKNYNNEEQRNYTQERKDGYDKNRSRNNEQRRYSSSLRSNSRDSSLESRSRRVNRGSNSRDSSRESSPQDRKYRSAYSSPTRFAQDAKHSPNINTHQQTQFEEIAIIHEPRVQDF